MQQTLGEQFRHVHGKARPLFTACLFGLGASLLSVGFQFAINAIYRWIYVAPSHGSFGRFALISFLAITGASLLTGWLLYSFCPQAAGSGIPEAKLSFWKEFGYTPRRIAWIKFVAGAICIGGGQSLGREGPSVQMGSGVGSSLAGFLGVAKQNRRAANAAGSAAGLAAAFNAPLASVAFVLEEIIGDLNSRFLGGVLLAAVIGAFVVHALIGPQPAFGLAAIGEPTWRAYLLMPLAAAFAALAGVFFQRGCLTLRQKARGFRAVPRWLLPVGGGLTTWAIGLAVFAWSGKLGIFSLGYDDLSSALTDGIGWKIALVLLVGKFFATTVCYGLGGCGGIFSPNLFFGAMCGICVAAFGSLFLDLTPAGRILLAVGGMSACLGAVVQAPVTAILIIFEMTHQFALVPGLMIAGLVSQAIARKMNHENFYEGVLLQDGHRLEKLIPPRDLQSWQNLPVSAVASFDPAVVEDFCEASLRELLRRHPYREYPVLEGGRLKGVASRGELEAALAEGRAPRLHPAVVCLPGDSIRACQKRIIDSASGIVVVAPAPEGPVLAILTLHDLLRAQAAMSERDQGA